jgi:hypothetical protein
MIRWPDPQKWEPPWWLSIGTIGAALAATFVLTSWLGLPEERVLPLVTRGTIAAYLVGYIAIMVRRRRGGD